MLFFALFYIDNKLKTGAKQNPNNNRGTTYQTDGKRLRKMVGYLVRGGEGVNIAFNCLKD
jgi:hypothetical protein